VESGLGIPVVHAEIDHLKPVHLSDRVRIELRPLRAGRRSVEFEAKFFGSDDELVAVARTVQVITTRGDVGEAQMPEWLRDAAARAPDRLPTDGS
jgi:acyl-CoA thioesterase FadM